jgi:hypothetical protein
VYNRGVVGGSEFPKGSSITNGAVSWGFGCIRGPDTLVTNAHRPSAWAIRGGTEIFAYAPIQESSIRKSSPEYDPGALGERELFSVCFDTSYQAYLGIDPLEGRPHKPIGLEIHTTVRAWSDEFSKRFVLVDWWFINISDRTIEKTYASVNVEPEIQYVAGWPGVIQWDESRGTMTDDICGFRSTVPGILPGLQDTMNIAWSSDNDGDPTIGDDSFLPQSPTSVIGVRVLRSPEGGRLCFNWWAYSWAADLNPSINWGPRRFSDRAVYGDSFGWPKGDRAFYHMMHNGEIDYDQAYAAVDLYQKGWHRPHSNEATADDIADGTDVAYVLSLGPFADIPPGDSVPLTVALVAGASFHRDPSNFINNFHPQAPKPYLDNLDFSDLITNARWADWVFDNPGVDTDGDGNRGRAYLINCDAGGCDSVFYKGDGVPDWRGPSAPPPPEFEITTKPAAVILRWSGAYSETFLDPFSRQRDFEGYRVYLGKFDQDEQYSLIASWDKEDYKRLAYDSEIRRWLPVSYPHAREEWPAILGDPAFDIADYATPSFEDTYIDTVVDTLRNPQGEIIATQPRERRSYWVPEDYNRVNEYDEAGHWTSNLIQKVGERDTIVDGQPLTYGLYEVTIDKLNPSVPLFVAVTAFDFGDFEHDLRPLESSQTNNSAYAEFIYSSDVVVDSNLRVSVFPNPYKSSYIGTHGTRTTYYLEGYEGRGVLDFAQQDRRIHFINLPDTAVIRIYSLDGDLIRSIHHPDPYLTTYSSSVGWDLISRNTQAVVSGIYIWKVDSKLGSQTGKLVIIK